MSEATSQSPRTTSSDTRRATRGPTSCSATARAAPVGKKTGKRAVDRDLPWAALRVSQRLQKAKEIADKLESIADDGIVDHMERADFDTALAFLRSLEETITDMLLWAMSRETEKSRPAATETALVK